MNIAEWSDDNQRRLGTYDALIDGDRVWTSTALHDRSCRVAGALVERGIVPGDRVLLLLPNGAEMIVAFTAVLRAGGVAVPIFAGVSAAEVERLIAHCAATALVTTTDMIASIVTVAESVRLRIGVGSQEDVVAPWLAFDRLAEHGDTLAQPVARSSSDPALIAYTSGASGTPKGVMYTHGSLAARHRTAPRFPVTLLVTLPFNTAGATTLTGRLMSRWTIVLIAPFDPRRFVEAIERYRVTMFAAVPSMCKAILALPDLGRYELRTLRYVLITGAHVPQGLIDALAAVLPVRPSVGYGMTEAGGGITSTSFGSAPGSVGRAIDGVEVAVRDEHGRDVPIGEPGEVHVRTPWMSEGYYQRPSETSATFHDGWLRTGDVGYLDQRGELFLVGRRTDLIIQSGVNVYATEVADLVAQMPDVEECAVVGLPHEVLGEEVVACVVRRVPSEISEDAVVRHCLARLDRRKVPVRVVFRETLPKTPTGKVATAQLRAELAGDQSGSTETLLVSRLRAAMPRERESLLAEAVSREIRRILGHASIPAEGSSVDVDRTFGELGLDSLGLARFVHATQAQLGHPVSPTLPFAHPTVGEFCRVLLAQIAGGAPAAIPAPSTKRRPRREEPGPVAIVGAGCRLPGADSPEGYWALLRDGRDATADISRWDMSGLYAPERGTPGKTYTRRAALIEGADMFDAEFFRVSTSEALALDPQHRLALEVTWAALEHAGYDPRGLAAVPVGLFLGICGSSYPAAVGIGASPAMAVGRICHFLDLRGPAAAIDTTCSSSLFAVDTAIQSLRRGDCDIALAGGVHVIGSPRSFVGLSQMGVIAEDGRCKTFDAAADGYGRGEGCVILVLKRLADAEADGDRVIAVLRGRAANHDGRSSSLTAPNGRAQQEVIHAALEDAGVSAADVDYLEAHGTGTSLGDPIEVEAAVSALSPRPHPLVLGSVKTNIGHLEAAAGAAGLLKVALALEHGEIPAHLHCRTLNPRLRPFAGAFVVPAATQPWPSSADHRRIAGVTSMGLSGTNVHIVVEEASASVRDEQGAAATATTSDGSVQPHLLCLSARSEGALDALAQQYADALRDAPDGEFADTCFTAGAGRSHFRHRVAVVAPSAAIARTYLRQLDSSATTAVARGAASGRPKIAFLFTGHGAQYVGMGRQLYESEPSFRDALQRCARVLDPVLPRALLDSLYGQDGRADLTLDDMALAQPVLFAFEWSVCALWRSWGIEPDIVLGHSIGECVAACVAGLLSLEDGLTLTAARGRLLQTLPPTGAMVSCRADEARVRQTIGALGVQVSIAAVNGPQSIVISGAARDVSNVACALADDGVEIRQLDIPRAAHSTCVEPVLDDLERVAASLSYASLQVPLVSTVTGEPATSSEMGRAEYWRRHMREPVQFAAAMAVAARGSGICLEVGPHPVLAGLGPDCVDAADQPHAWLASVRRDRGARDQMLETLGEMYVRGVDPQWTTCFGDGRQRVALPTYPFQRKSYWTAGVPESADIEPRAATRSLRPAEESTTAAPPRTLGARLMRESPERRASILIDLVQRQIAEVLGVSPDALSPGENVLERGLDSLRVLDVVTRLRRTSGAVCTPADFIARPSVDRFAAFLVARLRAADADESSCEPSASTAIRADSSAVGPLVTINERGSRCPIFCMHPSGGQASAYLRLREPLGPDQPLYAIQSRALDEPACEHGSLQLMAIDYATAVQCARPRGPYRLIGWSMGGVIAHAVAAELERRGATVDVVGMIDPAEVVQASRMAAARRQLMFALTAVMHESHPDPPTGQAFAAALAEVAGAAVGRHGLLELCERCDLIPRGALSIEAFGARLDLYRRHVRLVRAHRPRKVRAPIAQWWANASSPRRDWAAHTESGLTQTVVGGTHFTVMRPPHIDVVAADLRQLAGLAAASVT